MNTRTKLAALTALSCVGFFQAQAQDIASLPDFDLTNVALQMPDANAEINIDYQLAQRGATFSGSSSDNRTRSTSANGGRTSSNGNRQSAGDARGQRSAAQRSNTNNTTRAQRAEEGRRPASNYGGRPQNGRPADAGPRPASRPGGYPGYDDPMPPPPPPPAPEPVPVPEPEPEVVVVEKERWNIPNMLWVVSGVNLSNLNSGETDGNAQFKTSAGFLAGIRYDFSLFHSEMGYISLGANYSLMNFKVDYGQGQYTKYNASMLEMPLYMGLRGQLFEDVYCGVGVGPDFNVGFAGTCKSRVIEQGEDGRQWMRSSTHDTYGDEYYHTFTCGLSIEVWLNVKRIFVGYAFTGNFGHGNLVEPGLTDYSSNGYSNHTIKVGYRLK